MKAPVCAWGRHFCHENLSLALFFVTFLLQSSSLANIVYLRHVKSVVGGWGVHECLHFMVCCLNCLECVMACVYFIL